jgi:hypothetical protein
VNVVVRFCSLDEMIITSSIANSDRGKRFAIEGGYETCGSLNDEAQTGDYPAVRADGCHDSSKARP